MNKIEYISYLMYKVKVHKINWECNDNMYLNGFIELYEIRKW